MTPAQARWSLPHRPASVGEARSVVRRFVTELGEAGPEVHDAALLVSELISNALAHSGDDRHDIELELLAGDGVLHIEVRDHAAAPPVPQDARPDSEAGRGLLIVDRVSSRWGWATVDGSSKRVWCDVPCAGARGRP
ncbi:MAG: ATP-binding protein [Acidimicrobiales bacterium]